MQIHKLIISPSSPARSAVATASEIREIVAPDFYWQFRLARLIDKKSSDLAFSPKSYPDVSLDKDLYDAYYLDLTLQGKMDGFDWREEKTINDSDWQKIYKSICQWSASTAKANKPDTNSLPSNDFDLLKQFYPQLSFRDLEVPFVPEEVGANFPYKNLKELYSAAVSKEGLKIPGVSNSGTSLEAVEVKAQLKQLKESSMKKIDSIYADALTYAANPFPDDQARTHYKTLKAKLANFPQGAAAWATFRANMEKEVDEMARLASKPDDHHHHGEDADHVSPAKEFEMKYGKNLDEMQERMAKYKSDPQGFLEASIVEKFGKSGLDVWKKSQEFSSNLAVMSEADKAAAEKSFSDFLQKA